MLLVHLISPWSKHITLPLQETEWSFNKFCPLLLSDMSVCSLFPADFFLPPKGLGINSKSDILEKYFIIISMLSYMQVHKTLIFNLFLLYCLLDFRPWRKKLVVLKVLNHGLVLNEKNHENQSIIMCQNRSSTHLLNETHTLSFDHTSHF